MHAMQSRRHFLSALSAATAVGALGARNSLGDEAPPETTMIRLRKSRAICLAPRYLARDLLRAEGFTDVQYLPDLPFDAVAHGDLDLDLLTASSIVSQLDAGKPITALAGMHPGCYELFAHEPIRTVIDLKHRKVGVRTLDSGEHLLIAIMARHVGLDPKADIEWVVPADGNAMQLYIAGEVDAFLGFPPEPQQLRVDKVGRVILNMTTNQPWSQYFCCMACAKRDFVRNYPVATKRALRAILKATDICAADPEWAAQRLVDEAFADRYESALQVLTELPYNVWRDFDPEDSLRFYALRLHEAGMITSSPNALLAEGTDWRFLEELKRELKA
jgi:NitT/TauT family transport system substrate-binding protein